MSATEPASPAIPIYTGQDFYVPYFEVKLRGRPLPKDRKALERIGMYLMRRGFDAETARATIRAAGAETDDDSP